MTPHPPPVLTGDARWQGEAPGRLDVLGGVADYSGALVLQMPIRATTRVTLTPQNAPLLEFASAHEEAASLPLSALRALLDSGGTAAALRGRLDEHRLPRWVRYPLGCVLLLCRAQGWWPRGGLRLEVASDVPVAMGVSSSAALEVATLRALEAVSGRRFGGTELARLGQQAENEIVGAPCGLMDQLAAAHGTPGALLPILCRPDVLDEPVPLPEGAVAVGWPSGVKHAVCDSPYATARTAAFMGKKILERVFGRTLAHVTELPPSRVSTAGEDDLPPTLTGEAFLARYGDVDDPLARVEPLRAYPVRAAVSFPVEENFRCTLAVQLLRGVRSANRQATLEALGELLYQSHAGYSSIGLGCPETDAMVEAVRGLGPGRGFYGARVSGGGGGGTVAVLLEERALPDLDRLAASLSFGSGGRLPLIH
jgi:L-arabinokinase